MNLFMCTEKIIVWLLRSPQDRRQNEGCSFWCPEGTIENSPSFQRWVGRQKVGSPAGTAEVQSYSSSFNRPFGTSAPGAMSPGVIEIPTNNGYGARVCDVCDPRHSAVLRLTESRSISCGGISFIFARLNKTPGYSQYVPPGQRNAEIGFSAMEGNQPISDAFKGFHLDGVCPGKCGPCSVLGRRRGSGRADSIAR
jgi:hypothetical protein